MSTVSTVEPDSVATESETSESAPELDSSSDHAPGASEIEPSTPDVIADDEAPVASTGPVVPRTASAEYPWGRVEDGGAVFVRDTDGERQVGEYPDAPAAEAIAYFERKYTDLAAQVGLLEQRARRGAAPADVAKAVERLTASLATANAVGDLQALRDRLGALRGTTREQTAKQSEEHQAQVEAARVEREAIVVETETLAARDASTVQWKATSQALDDLFARWQEAQRTSTRLPKSEANAFWTRFRAARTIIETQRRAFFAEQDSSQRTAKEAKEKLVTRAEALTGSSGDAIGTYRALLEEWKLAGRAGRKVDDALWARFRAAGDTLYSAKTAAVAEQNEEYDANLAAKTALLDEAEPLLEATDHAAARTTLTSIQRRWDAVGRVPREQVRPIEDRLRRVETAVKQLEQDHWRRSNPETKARSEGLASQLNSAIGKLENELAEARAAGDARAIKSAEESLAARRIWLDAING